MTTLTMTEAVSMYRTGNNAGEGYAPGGEDIDAAVAEMIEEGGTLVLERRTSDDVAVVELRGKLVAIGGDASGNNAWAVKIKAAV